MIFRRLQNFTPTFNCHGGKQIFEQILPLVHGSHMFLSLPSTLCVCLQKNNICKHSHPNSPTVSLRGFSWKATPSKKCNQNKMREWRVRETRGNDLLIPEPKHPACFLPWSAALSPGSPEEGKTKLYIMCFMVSDLPPSTVSESVVQLVTIRTPADY